MKRGQFWSNKLKQKDFKRLTYVLQIYKLCVVMEIKTEFWHIMVNAIQLFIGNPLGFLLLRISQRGGAHTYNVYYCVSSSCFYSSFLFYLWKFFVQKVHLFHDFELFFSLFTLFYFILFIDMHIHNFYVCIQII